MAAAPSPIFFTSNVFRSILITFYNNKDKKTTVKTTRASKGNRRTLNGTKIVKTNFKMLPDEELISGLTACCPKRKHIFEHFTDESQNRDLRGIADFLRSGRRATFGLSKVELKEKMSHYSSNHQSAVKALLMNHFAMNGDYPISGMFSAESVGDITIWIFSFSLG